MISVTKGPRIKLESSDYRGSNNPQLNKCNYMGIWLGLEIQVEQSVVFK